MIQAPGRPSWPARTGGRARRKSYPKAAHTVDVALFTVDTDGLAILLVRRANQPHEGRWALPGGFVDMGKTAGFGEGEDLDDAARRELYEETGLKVLPDHLEQLKTYGSPTRDERGRVISTAFVALASKVAVPRARDDAAAARFFPVGDITSRNGPDLAFDHAEIVRDALARVRSKVEYEGRLAASFVAKEFTIPGLRRVYEAIWGGPVRRGDFRRKVLSVDGFLVATGEQTLQTGGPPAALYRLGHATELHPPMLRESMLMESERRCRGS